MSNGIEKTIHRSQTRRASQQMEFKTACLDAAGWSTVSKPWQDKYERADVSKENDHLVVKRRRNHFYQCPHHGEHKRSAQYEQGAGDGLIAVGFPWNHGIGLVFMQDFQRSFGFFIKQSTSPKTASSISR